METKTITVNDSLIPWNEGMTVRKVLELKKYTFKMLLVKINGQLIKKNEYDIATVPEGAEVKVIHLMSGG